MNLQHKILIDIPLSKTADVLTQGFAEYFVPININKRTLLDMIRRQGIDLSTSYMIFDEKDCVGVALIGRRGWSSRLAAMSILPAYRGKGIGSSILDKLIEDAKKRQDRSLSLEVIDQNEAGIKLYTRLGFTKTRNLFSYVKEAEAAHQCLTLQETSLTALSNLVFQYGLKHLPWQIAAETLANSNAPLKAYTFDSAYIVLSEHEEKEVTVHSVLVLPEVRGQGKGRQLLELAMQQFQGRTWNIPALCPEEVGGFFEKMGFEKQELAQLQMELKL